MSRPEWGIFDADGMVEAGFSRVEDAKACVRALYPDRDVRVRLCCSEHPDEPADACGPCLRSLL